MRCFGYKIHLVVNTCYELPFDFRVEKESVSKTKMRSLIAIRLKNASHTRFDHAARCGRVRISKINEFLCFRNTEILGHSPEFASRTVFLPPPTPANRKFHPLNISYGTHSHFIQVVSN